MGFWPFKKTMELGENDKRVKEALALIEAQVKESGGFAIIAMNDAKDRNNVALAVLLHNVTKSHVVFSFSNALDVSVEEFILAKMAHGKSQVLRQSPIQVKDLK